MEVETSVGGTPFSTVDLGPVVLGLDELFIAFPDPASRRAQTPRDGAVGLIKRLVLHVGFAKLDKAVRASLPADRAEHLMAIVQWEAGSGGSGGAPGSASFSMAPGDGGGGGGSGEHRHRPSLKSVAGAVVFSRRTSGVSELGGAGGGLSLEEKLANLKLKMRASQESGTF